MNWPVPTRSVAAEPHGLGAVPGWQSEPGELAGTLKLPILSRSADLLQLLVEDQAIDLELADCVLSLDPGLAYGTLQLANRLVPDASERLWQLSAATITAGRDAVADLAKRSQRVELRPIPDRLRLCRLIRDAVVRGSIAHHLARNLASCPPRKCFLSGLLFDIAEMARVVAPNRNLTPALLLADLCRSLPAAVVRAAIETHDMRPEDEIVDDPLVAIVCIADGVLQAEAHSDPAMRLHQLTEKSCWHSFGPTEPQRDALLAECCTLREWVLATLHVLDPWKFMAKLERERPWE